MRSHRIITNELRTRLVQDNKNYWPNYIPAIQWGINSTPRDDGLSPFECLCPYDLKLSHLHPRLQIHSPPSRIGQQIMVANLPHMAKLVPCYSGPYTIIDVPNYHGEMRSYRNRFTRPSTVDATPIAPPPPQRLQFKDPIIEKLTTQPYQPTSKPPLPRYVPPPC